jgi:hypothetical protein
MHQEEDMIRAVGAQMRDYTTPLGAVTVILEAMSLRNQPPRARQVRRNAF